MFLDIKPILGGILAGLVAVPTAQAVGVTLTFGSPTSVTNLVLKPGETCELRALTRTSYYATDPERKPLFVGEFHITVSRDGLEWRHVYSPFFSPSVSPSLVVAGPATVMVSDGGVPSAPSSYVSISGYATFEVTPAPVGAEKLVVAPEGQSTRLVLESSTNLTQWAPVFSTVLTNVPANQFVRIRAEKLP